MLRPVWATILLGGTGRSMLRLYRPVIRSPRVNRTAGLGCLWVGRLRFRAAGLLLRPGILNLLWCRRRPGGNIEGRHAGLEYALWRGLRDWLLEARVKLLHRLLRLITRTHGRHLS